MKRYLLALLISCVLFSCEDSENPNILEMPQEWSLIGYKSSWVADPPLIPITDSIYNYRLEKNGSFIKNLGIYRLTGTYEIDESTDDRTYISLIYDEASITLNEESGRNLIHYCGQNYEPFVVVDSKTISGSWGACDGPNFIFQRK
ncbi:hypothetical protein SAMN04489724_3796 [Algoriphagus locisalis]|uniref:Lipocalin-like domain-containing protein n=1 Tax=Algoriphagus locisalis TaxID=305507 RepID=A0A1I7D9F8_9BACT|nr:hypothetical protein [Algoriphagus locisalis]SFU08301.1 hypothetical protein SAMN04489724_3796 [Algoriphagus locisalis]